MNIKSLKIWVSGKKPQRGDKKAKHKKPPLVGVEAMPNPNRWRDRVESRVG